MNITLKQLHYFRALAEERNFGRAALRVHVSQPALSMQIRELEETLGAPLVERLPRDVRLTPAGREVLERARRALDEVEMLAADARSRRLSGRINLGVIPTVAPYLLPHVLMTLRRSGQRDLRVREAQTADLIAGLNEGRLDAAVIATPQDDSLTVEPLFADRFLLAGAAARLATLDPERLRPVALDPGQLLLLDEGHCLADQALEVCGLSRRVTRVDLGASSLATLCGLAAEDFGLTFLPEIALRAEQAAAPGLAVRRFSTPEPERQIALVRRAGSPSAPWFADLAARLAEAGADLVRHARERVPEPAGAGAGAARTQPPGSLSPRG